MCTGWDVEQVKSIVGETLHDIVDPLVFAEAADLIADHKICGRDVVVVSASGEEIVAPIARALGATHAMATRMVVEDGRYTGEIAFYCYGEGKVEAIRQLAAREGYALEHCYAYSDSITDLPMLGAVGHPTVVNPDRALRKEAAARGWPVAHLLQARVPARPHSRPIGRCRRDHRGGRGERPGRGCADVLAAAPLRFLRATSCSSWHRRVTIASRPQLTLDVTGVTEYKGSTEAWGGQDRARREGSISQAGLPSTDPGTHAEHMPRNRQKCCGPA